MSKALRIKIISYLREHDAVTKYVDIRAHVLNDNDSVEERNELKATLDYLSNKRLIAINGSYEFLYWTVSYGLYNLDGKRIATKLTKTGQAYHPESESDDMEATVPPVLAVIKKGAKAKNENQVTTYDHAVDTAVEELPVTAEPEPLPWYTAPVQPEVETIAEPESTLPWYAEPKAERPLDVFEETILPEYTAPSSPPIAETVTTAPESTLPWYVIPEEEKPLEEVVAKPTLPSPPVVETITSEPEPTLPWYVIPEEEKPVTETTAEPALQPEPEVVMETEPLHWYTPPEHDEAETFEAEMLTEAPEIKYEEPAATKPPLDTVPSPEARSTAANDVLKALEGYVPLKPWYVEPAQQEPEKKAELREPEPVPMAAPPVEESAKLPWDTEIAEQAPVEAQQEQPLDANVNEPEQPTKQPLDTEVKEPAVQESTGLPWYTEAAAQTSVDESLKQPLDTEVKEPAVQESTGLPWYTETVVQAPVEEPTKEPLDTEVKQSVVQESTGLPWYAETVAQTPAELSPKLPWDAEVTAQAPVAEEKQPVIYRFPPLELKPESVVKTPPPMVIERLNQNLSSGIDAISNIKIKKPEMLTGDFEKDSNVIMKFVLIIVLFLLFGCIVWVYMG
jgi:hypothetical protein